MGENRHDATERELVGQAGVAGPCEQLVRENDDATLAASLDFSN